MLTLNTNEKIQMPKFRKENMVTREVRIGKKVFDIVLSVSVSEHEYGYKIGLPAVMMVPERQLRL